MNIQTSIVFDRYREIKDEGSDPNASSLSHSVSEFLSFKRSQDTILPPNSNSAVDKVTFNDKLTCLSKLKS